MHLNCVLPDLVVRCVLRRCCGSIASLCVSFLIDSSTLVYYLPSFINFLPPRSLSQLLLGSSGVRVGIPSILVLDLLERDVVVLDSWDLHEVVFEFP